MQKRDGKETPTINEPLAHLVRLEVRHELGASTAEGGARKGVRNQIAQMIARMSARIFTNLYDTGVDFARELLLENAMMTHSSMH